MASHPLPRNTVEALALDRAKRLDELTDSYVAWREDEAEVRRAYARLRDADSRELEGVYWAYRAALDREEHAALVYADRLRCVTYEFAATGSN